LRLLRAALTALLSVCLWNAATAKAAGVEYLMVPSAAMGRDNPVAFEAGGPHAVVLLDAFNAAPDVSNWVTAGNAMKTFAGKGVSVAAPASGAWSLYTDWEQDSGRQWETFLANELPDWLAAKQGSRARWARHRRRRPRWYWCADACGVSPRSVPVCWVDIGLPDPSATTLNGAITAGLAQFGGVDIRNMWGLSQLGRWKWHDPDVHVQQLVDNNTRLWVFSPSSLTCSDPAAMIGYCDQAQGSNRTFYSHYRAVGGHNGHFDIPTSGQHDRGTWGPQLAAMSGDLAAAIKLVPTKGVIHVELGVDRGSQISTRTRHKRILDQDNLIRSIVELHVSKLSLVLRRYDSWESTALNWCVGLRAALCAHPHLTDLMTDEDVLVIGDYIDRLVEYAVGEGFSRKAAAEFCRVLASVTINHAIREARAATHSGNPTRGDSRALKSSRSFGETVRLILAGVRAESPDLHPTMRSGAATSRS
jgi:S-formylglutathione hydrolase FrmB